MSGAAALFGACSISPEVGESPADCADDLDNDEDGVSDCGDPDCQALSVCGGSARSIDPATEIGDAYVGEPPDAGGEAEPPVATPTDEPEPEPAVPSDPPPTMEPPAEPEPVETGCPDGCGENQSCVNNECVDSEIVVVELWDIAEIEVRVPRSVEPSPDYTCLDPNVSACGFLGASPYLLCFCAPDPQVRVWVDVDPSDAVESEFVGETAVAIEKDQTTWSSPGLTLRLLPTSVITLKVVDEDLGGDEPIFNCNVQGSVALEGGPLECKTLFPPDDPAALEFYIRVQVTPTQVTPPT